MLKCSSYSLSADDKTVLEGGDRRARLQRQEVATPYPSRYPVFVGPHGKAFKHFVVVSGAVSGAECDPLSPRQLVEMVEDQVASRAWPSEAVAGEVDVPLRGIRLGQRGVRKMDHTLVQGAPRNRVQTGAFSRPREAMVRDNMMAPGGRG